MWLHDSYNKREEKKVRLVEAVVHNGNRRLRFGLPVHRNWDSNVLPVRLVPALLLEEMHNRMVGVLI